MGGHVTHGQQHHPDEARYLERIISEIERQMDTAGRAISRSADSTKEVREYFWDALRDMDGAEKASIRTMVNTDTATEFNARRILGHLAQARSSPYFARIDFRRDEEPQPRAHYIGIRGLRRDGQALIHDWRAPLSGMFYDFEEGEAAYQAPEGRVSGAIDLKRQFVIRDSRLEAIVDTSVSIDDDVLKRELSTRPDDKMRTIVATIQREQNSVIRNEESKVLLIQGAAGSGKTSIALHRVAYMLYRFQHTISAQDVLVLSPNRVFGDYIVNVLPELGEEAIPEMEFERLAVDILGPKVRFQRFHEQVESLLLSDDAHLRARIREKSTIGFHRELARYLQCLDETHFFPQDITLSTITMSAAEVAERFRGSGLLSSMPLRERVAKLSRTAVTALKHRAQSERVSWRREWTAEVNRAVKEMFPLTTAEAVYRNFFIERGTPELFSKLRRNTYEYNDVFPLAYTALHIDRRVSPRSTQHVVVDEMQDYTPTHYAVLNAVHRCSMTILGDAYQAVSPDGSSSMDVIADVFPDSDQVTLRRSYRSTLEITRLAQRISPNPDLIPFDRRGEPPTVTVVKRSGQLNLLRRLITSPNGPMNRSLGVLCRTAHEATALHRRLADDRLTLIDHTSQQMADGPVVTTIHMAKGLEFDHVIVADASDAEYGNEHGRALLYIACTRATTRLDIISVGPIARWLEDAQEEAGSPPSPRS